MDLLEAHRLVTDLMAHLSSLISDQEAFKKVYKEAQTIASTFFSSVWPLIS